MTDEASEPRTVAAPGVVSRGATTDAFTPRRALRDERWWFPSLVVVAFAVAVVLGLSGSSVAQLEPEAQRDDTLVGSSRPIRSDEWAVRTPFVVGQEERGLGVDAPVGVGDHNAAVLYDLPTSDWSMLFRPHLWGYVVLPIDQAFAFDWWALSLVLLLGTYALVLVITRSWRWAALAAVALWASPFFHWWYLSITLATVGYAAAMIAAALVAIRSRDRRRRLVASAAAVWFGGCFAVLLYPPFQVPTVIVLGLWALGAEWGSPTWTHRVRRRAAIATLAAIGVGIGGVVAAFAATRADAISAIANTAYPGTRRIAGGDGSVNMLSSAWFGWNFLTEPEALRSRVFANESEASSFVMLGLFLLAGLPLAWRWLTRGAGVVRSVLAALSVAVAVIAGHLFVGLPAPMTRLTLLDRVQPVRGVIGLGIASVALAVAIGMAVERRQLSQRVRLGAGALTALLCGGYALALAVDLRAAGAPVAWRESAIPLVVAVGTSMAFWWRPFVAAAVLAAFGVVVSLAANPLQRGLDPLTSSPLVRAVHAADRTRPGGHRWWLSSGDQLTPMLTGSGVANLGAVNLYPNERAWHVLDPHGASEETWNRYAHTAWTFRTDVRKPVISLMQPDVIGIEIDPCGPELDRLGVGHLVTVAPLDASCVRLESRSTAPSGATAFIYERERDPSAR